MTGASSMLDVGPELPGRRTLIKAVQRESKYRAHVYPRRIQSERMTLAKAREEVLFMTTIWQLLEHMTDTEYSQIMQRRTDG